MNLPTPDQPWQAFANLLQAEAGLERTFPPDHACCSLLDALTRNGIAVAGDQTQRGVELHNSLSGLLGQLAVFESISRCPILAITGLLNAGKSSLLATYLSPANRGRVLRGLGNQSGTHRFVLWLPKVWWTDSELLTVLIGFLTNLFGHAPEQLSDDPDEAALQYNGRVLRSIALPTAARKLGANDEDTVNLGSAPRSDAPDGLSVPLIAYDEALDALKLGLLDCPDIQTGFLATGRGDLRGDELAAARKEQLSKIGRLCSAFVVVSKLNSLHDDGLLQVLTTLRDAMPGVPRLLAINKVKSRYAPHVVLQQARGLVDRFGIDAVFAAYDFRSSLAHSRVPLPPARLQPSENSESLPIFFEAMQDVEKAPASTPPTSIRYLHDLGDRLDAGALSRESSRSLMLQLRARAAESIEWMEKNQALRESQIRDAWQAVADACYEFMAERDASGKAVGLRLQASPAIVAQMADSLQRTAPAWMRVSLSIDRSARQFHQAVSNSAARFKVLQSASKSVTQFTKRFRRGEGAQVVTPQRLAEALRSSDMNDALTATTDEQLVAGCETAMKRFAEEDKTLLNQEELDAWGRQVWETMSLKEKLWKGTQPLAVLMAPLLAAVLVPIDGGGTAVLVFASTKELLAAAGIAAVMTPMATGGEALSVVQRETPWRQLSDLFAILCDSLGLPRPVNTEMPTSKCAGGERRLLPCNLESKLPRSHVAVNRWAVNRETMTELQRIIQQQP